MPSNDDAVTERRRERALSARVTALRARNAAAEHRIVDLERALARAEAAGAALAARDEELAATSTRLRERETELAQVDATLRECETELARVTATLVERDSDLAGVTAELAQLETELSQSRTELAARGVQVVRAEQRIADLVRELRESEAVLAAAEPGPTGAVTPRADAVGAGRADAGRAAAGMREARAADRRPVFPTAAKGYSPGQVYRFVEWVHSPRLLDERPSAAFGFSTPGADIEAVDAYVDGVAVTMAVGLRNQILLELRSVRS